MGFAARKGKLAEMALTTEFVQNGMLVITNTLSNTLSNTLLTTINVILIKH